MGLHEDALALARQTSAKEQARSEARKQAEREAISQVCAACKKAIMRWMTEIGMTPQPMINLRYLGSHGYYEKSVSWDAECLGIERRVGAVWFYGGHQYRAEYGNGYHELDLIEIMIEGGNGTGQLRRMYWGVRQKVGRSSIEDEKRNIGLALQAEENSRTLARRKGQTG